uniref:Nicotinamide N-methyltransferase n=1 Tax=Sphenodon punctatus TaxID=8508 RepID=A0A8D0GJT4_SPHPU
MERNFTEKDAYEQYLVPSDYLETYYSFDSESHVKDNLIAFHLKNLHKAFLVDGIKGDTLIDIGSGVTIYQHLSACESFKEIIATDYTTQAREELQKWLKNEPGAFDWSPVVKYVCELEGNRYGETFGYRCSRVLMPSLRMPACLSPADSILDLQEGIAPEKVPVKNITSLLKPGGHLVLLGVLEGTYYMVGQRRFSCLYLEQKSIEEWVEMTPNHYSWTVTDSKGAFGLVAQKYSEGH